MYLWRLSEIMRVSHLEERRRTDGAGVPAPWCCKRLMEITASLLVCSDQCAREKHNSVATAALGVASEVPELSTAALLQSACIFTSPDSPLRQCSGVFSIFAPPAATPPRPSDHRQAMASFSSARRSSTNSRCVANGVVISNHESVHSK